MLQSANQAEDVEHQRIALAQMPMRPAGAGSGARLLELYHRFRDQPLIHPFWRGVVEESRRRGVNPRRRRHAVPSEPARKPTRSGCASRASSRSASTRPAFAVLGRRPARQPVHGARVRTRWHGDRVLYLAPLVPGPQGSTNYPYAMLNDVDDDIEHRAPIMHTQPASRDAPYNRFRDEVAAGVSTATGVAKASVLMPAQASEPRHPPGERSRNRGGGAVAAPDPPREHADGRHGKRAGYPSPAASARITSPPSVLPPPAIRTSPRRHGSRTSSSTVRGGHGGNQTGPGAAETDPGIVSESSAPRGPVPCRSESVRGLQRCPGSDARSSH
jgi:hypothetical protein